MATIRTLEALHARLDMAGLLTGPKHAPWLSPSPATARHA
jgi:hypothetical protein